MNRNITYDVDGWMDGWIECNIIQPLKGNSDACYDMKLKDVVLTRQTPKDKQCMIPPYEVLRVTKRSRMVAAGGWGKGEMGSY